MAFTKVLWAVIVLVFFVIKTEAKSTLLKDILTVDTNSDITRLPRELPYRTGRQASTTTQTVSSSRPSKPEDSADPRDRDTLERRCARCDYYYYNRDRDYRNPYPYDSRNWYDDRYDDRYYRERERYNDDRYRDRIIDDYDRRYYDSDRKYNDYDRERYDRYDRRPETNDRYDRYDRYDKNDRNNVKYYERDRYDKGDVNRYYDRYDKVGYRPWDETTRGSSGFDNNGRGYYFAVGRPEYSSYGSGYASNWNYSRDDDRDRSWQEQGFGGGSYRPRDPYDPGYRATSYLYDRQPSTTTTELPIPSEGHIGTDRPQS